MVLQSNQRANDTGIDSKDRPTWLCYKISLSSKNKFDDKELQKEMPRIVKS